MMEDQEITFNMSNQAEIITPLMSDAAYEIFDLVVVQIFLLIVSVLGVFTNILNIIVYANMSMSDTSNINFLALSTCDLLTVLYMVLTAVGHIPALARIEYPVTFLSLQNMLVVVAYPAMASGSWITALISTERCACIVLPLKVKSIFTPRRTIIAVVVILVFEMSSIPPHYATMYLTWEFSPELNKSVLISDFTEESAYISVNILLVFFSAPSLISFTIVTICTSFLVVKLNQSVRWRKSTQHKADDKALPLKELRVVRAVTFICIIYIFGFLPNVVIMPTSVIYPKFHVVDPYLGTVVFAFVYFGFAMQAFSASINFFVYLNMSTKYRETLQRILFCRGSGTGNKV